MFSNEEIERRYQENMKEYLQAITPIVKVAYGNTYIKNLSLLRDETFDRLRHLLDLMNVEFSFYNDIPETENCLIPSNSINIMISGDDPGRAAFIERFINNGFILNWREFHVER